jgi:hypothetical protein
VWVPAISGVQDIRLILEELVKKNAKVEVNTTPNQTARNTNEMYTRSVLLSFGIPFDLYVALALLLACYLA